MSNRIDLTQFEKITAGEWSIIRNGNRIDIGVGTSSAYSPIITFTAELAEVVMKIERDVADMNAIAAIPNLLAELKRCYEEIDALRSITQDWVKIETFTDDGKDLSVDMEDSDGNCFSGYINRASE